MYVSEYMKHWGVCSTKFPHTRKEGSAAKSSEIEMTVRRTMGDENICVVWNDGPTTGSASDTRTWVLEGAIAVLRSKWAAKDFECATAHLDSVSFVLQVDDATLLP
jgi:hypothetical protein